MTVPPVPLVLPERYRTWNTAPSMACPRWTPNHTSTRTMAELGRL